MENSEANTTWTSLISNNVAPIIPIHSNTDRDSRAALQADGQLNQLPMSDGYQGQIFVNIKLMKYMSIFSIDLNADGDGDLAIL